MKTTDKKQAQEIERVLAFLNSRGVGFETGIDQLSNIESASRFLASSLGVEVNLSKSALMEIKRLRQVLLDLVASEWKDSSARDGLNEISKRSLYTLSFESGPQTELTPSSSSTVIGVILRDVAALIDRGEWNRIKNCSDEACASTFFDRSRNRTQRWHSFEICGNKHNVAAHRARGTREQE